MESSLNAKRIAIFLAFAFGIPWAAALVVYLTGMARSNPAQAISTANYVFIFTPWLASLATRLVTREGWGNLWLRPRLRTGWRFYLAAWLLPVLATLVGTAAFYLIFPQSFDAGVSNLTRLIEGTPMAGMSPLLLLLATLPNLLIVAPLINMVVSLGEELGWRGYLLPKLVARLDGAGHNEPLPDPAAPVVYASGAARKAALLIGLIHGVWHWPLILLSVGVAPGTTYLTPLVYLLLTVSMSLLLSWATLRARSVWPAALGHGAINASSALPNLLLRGQPVSLIGPDPTGLIGGIGYALLALALFFRRGAFPGNREIEG